MKIQVTVKPKSKKAFIKMLGMTEYIISVHEAPDQGKANKAVIKALAEYLSLTPSKIKLISGKISKRKIFEIPS